MIATDSTSKTSRTALIVAGGTGGHIFPGLSVAEKLTARGWQVRWVGNPNAMEGQLVPKAGLVICPLVFSGFRGKGLRSQLLMPMKLLQAFWVSIQILRQNKPAVVLGMGGYVAFPLGMMASLFNVPLVVHEQNSIAGLTNKVLARLADRVLVAFPDALTPSHWVGNPVRETMASQAAPAERYAGRTGPLRVLVVGGSLGAAALNETVPQAVALLAKGQRPELVHQSGQRHLVTLNQAYEKAGVQAQCVAFIDDMAEAMAQADVLICRAGAMTVAEVASIGVAALLVPFPHAVDDHQTTNAEFLVSAGGASMRQQSELSAEWLAHWLAQLTREACCRHAELAHAKAKPQSAETVAAMIEEVAKTQ